jgi:cytosine/adenosine deaminase-related metal-dependent hydrolase
MLAFRARYVFPLDGPPISDGVVAIDHDRIVAVGPSTSTAVQALLPAARDLGSVAILPGLVNAHTHLEFSSLEQPLGSPGMPFTDWIRFVVRSRRERLAASHGDPIAAGIAQSVAAGVTCLGEIASSPWQPPTSLPLEVTQFCEVISFRRDRDDQRFQTAVNAISGEPSETGPTIRWTDTCRPAISPHTPYTVRPELIQKCVELSAQRRIPLALHLAESREELLLLRSGAGPAVQLMEDFGQWDSQEIAPGTRPLDYLKLLAQANRSLVIHGNYLDGEEIQFLAAHRENMSVVYCPRTHAFFQHDPYPLAKMLSAGVNVALGTDSRASNPDLSILAEMRFAAAKHPAVPPAKILEMITSSAARALGRDEELGTLTLGKFADLTFVALPESKSSDPHEQLLDPACRVVATIFRGRGVHGEKLLQSI